MLTNFSEKLAFLSKEMEEVKKRMQKEAEEAFHTAAKDFFVEFPKVKEITWAQYTPYFNDGETCYFSISDVYFLKEAGSDYPCPYQISEESDIVFLNWNLDFFEKYSPKYDSQKPDAHTYEGMNIMTRFLNDIDDQLQNFLGDHIMVVLNADGIEVREYDHE